MRFGGEASQFVRVKFEAENSIGLRSRSHGVDDHFKTLTTLFPHGAIVQINSQRNPWFLPFDKPHPNGHQSVQ